MTVGSQVPFDRMVRAVDDWADERQRSDVFAQIGRTVWRPRRMEWTAFMSPSEFESAVQKASAMVAHAGVGTILAALTARLPIVIVPRRADLGEHRSDHQLATAAHFRQLGIAVVEDERELPEVLDHLEELKPGQSIPDVASPQLVDALRRFIAGEL